MPGNQPPGGSKFRLGVFGVFGNWYPLSESESILEPPMTTPAMSDTTTHGIRVGATAYYLPDESDPDHDEYFFGYRIVIHNTSDLTVRLISRHWDIIDGNGELKKVDGDGVVGEQPVLGPGQAFRYTSFCPLHTSWGTMEGDYRMQHDTDGEQFDAKIGRFWLTTERTLSNEQPDAS